MKAKNIKLVNWKLLYRADYSNPRAIKKLLLSMDSLRCLAQKGDTVALSIYLDLKDALYAEGVLSKKQRKYLLLWMAGYEQNQIGWMCGAGQDVISRGISRGAKNISKYLQE